MNEKGLSGLVATVLLIILAIGAVALIWAFLSPSLSGAGSAVNERTLCLSATVEPKSCEMVAGNVEVLAEARSDGVAGIVAVIEFEDGSISTGELQGVLNIFATQKLVISHEGKVVKNVKTSAMIEGQDGNLVICQPSSKKIECKQTGCVSDDECGNDPHFTCEAGVCLLTGDLTVFITNETHTGNFGGIWGVDDFCQDLADGSSAIPAGNYRAWVSNMNNDAIDRISRTNGNYVRVDGVVVSQNWTNLIDGSLDNPISVDNNNFLRPGQVVATGTLADGTEDASSQCNNWQGGGTAEGGMSSSVNSGWTTGTAISCANPAYFYCVEYVGNI